MLLTDVLRGAPPGAAIAFPDERVTYAALLRRVERRAAGLRAWGVGPGDRVALHLPASVEWVALWFATAWLDADLVPLDTRLSDAEVRSALEGSGARWLVWGPSTPAEHPARVHVVVHGLPVTMTQAMPYADEPLPCAETGRASWVLPGGSVTGSAELVRDALAWPMPEADTVLVADPLPGRGATVLLAAMAHGANVVLVAT